VTGYRYRSLTTAVDDKSSPLRRYLDQRYPNTKPVQAPYRSGAGPLLVGQSRANAGTLGTAFDLIVKLTLDHTHVPPVSPGFLDLPHLWVISEVLRVAQTSADEALSGDLDEETARACWALALCSEAYRLGVVYPDSSLDHAINDDRFSPEGLIAIATDDAVRDLQLLHSVAVDNLYPHLPTAPNSLTLGPTFDGSKLCSADADLVIDGLLVELKTRLGTETKRSGMRHDSMSLIDLYQVIAYVLFDHSDSFAIGEVAFYSGRYGHFFQTPIDDLLRTLAGEPIDLSVERSTVWSLLGGA